MSQHDCSRCCMTRRQCIQWLSLSALGAGVLSRSRGTALGEDSSQPAPSDVIDPLSLCPRPDVRIAATFLEQPRPYWLGWPGTTYDLERHQGEYRSLLEQSAQRTGVTLGLEAKPIQDDAGLTAWIEKLKAEQPHGLLVMLQHMGSLVVDRADCQRDQHSFDRLRTGRYGFHGSRRECVAAAAGVRHFFAGMVGCRGRPADGQGQTQVRGNTRAVDSR